VLLIHPVFSWLAKNDHTIVVTFLYVLTVVIVIAFGIEIGQGITHTGNMEFADIMYGLVGFLAMFGVFSVLRMIYHGIIRLVKYIRRRIELKEAAQAQIPEEQDQEQQI
jgi:hypothetical protein